MAAEKRDLKQSYLNGDADLMGLAKWPWPVTDFGPVIAARKAVPINRELLVSEMMKQYEGMGDAELTRLQIQKISSENTFTVTTGHQVCLLGGPMFTLYKIATVIGLASVLSHSHPGKEFVPVLWMATEDHDWEEVNHFFTSFTEKRVYPGKFKGPVGRHVLEPSILETLSESTAEWIRACYSPGRTMAEAFRMLMHHLFGKHGLVILDADRPALKAAFGPTMSAELQLNGMAGPVKETTQHLEDLGFKPQILPRTINLFYIGDGERTLIDIVENRYQLKGGNRSWSKAEILQELADFPENFSPNVALRPVYQETLLPNVATVGGWAEVSYWLQLKAGFQHLGVPFPPLVPRLHATLFTNEQAASIAELGLQMSVFTEPLHIIQERYLKQNWDDSPLEKAILKVQEAYEQLAAMVTEFDPTLATGVKAEQARSSNALEALPKKVKKALRNRNPQPYQQIAALKNAIEPENASQQRVLNFTAFNSVEPLSLVDSLVLHGRIYFATTQWIILP